jgi:hypothetical protein
VYVFLSLSQSLLSLFLSQSLAAMNIGGLSKDL